MSEQQCITLKHVAEIRNGPSYKREHNQFMRCHDRVTTGATIQTYLSNRMLRLALDKRQINQSVEELNDMKVSLIFLCVTSSRASDFLCSRRVSILLVVHGSQHPE